MRILFCGIAAAIIGFLIAEVLPPRYSAEMQVLMAPYQQTVGGSQTPVDESVKDIINSAAPRSPNTQVDMLQSMGVIQAAALQVAHDFNKPDPVPGDELYPQQLRERLNIEADAQSDIVTLSVQMSSAAMAQDLLAQMYNAFEKENHGESTDSAQRAIDFLTSQQDKIQSDLGAIENKEANARMELGAPNIEQVVVALISQKKEYETQLEAAKGEEASSRERANDLSRQLSEVPRQMPGGSSTAENPKYTKLMSLREEAVAGRSEALGRYLPDSVQVKQFDTEISNLDQELSHTNQYSPSIKSSSAPNPVYEQLYQEYAIADANARGATSRVASLQTAMDQLDARMARLPEIQRKLDDLDRQKTVLANVAAMYTEKLTTLKVAGSARTSATHLWTSPVSFPKAVYPNYPLCVGLGFFLGLAGGFLWAIGTEATRNPIRSLGQLNRLSLQPCYRVIPELRTPVRSLNRAPADVFDSLLANYARSEKQGYRMGVLGVNRNAGASTTAINLAIAAARAGHSVLYVALDPGNTALSKLSAGSDAKGLSGSITVFDMSPSGGESNGSAGLPNDIETAAKGKDLVIFDFSPVKVSGDAFRFANHLDEILLLVRANHTKSVDFLQAQQALVDAGCPIVTVTLSRLREYSDDITALEQQTDIRSIAPQV
ncbi:MAG TPA: hypothetical protein VMI31_05870 [Fimbriimonadaceae bacterium]|nr:hypothetical protein [Fimbriimonadaceae bacterium]